MNYDDFPLSMFEVECDGSACGSGPTALHLHPEQYGNKPLAKAIVRNGVRIRYEHVSENYEHDKVVYINTQ